ncbi:hypothetical protein G7Y79_00006g019640 [Physcia stellaris]|nr:hypothetical protein G7Y79_00006g019640 [Physcia stellaris]
MDMAGYPRTCGLHGHRPPPPLSEGQEHPLKHGLRDRASYARMTNDQAQAILKDLTELEFPKLFGFSIIFALFKTYGIPTVSSLLVTTGQLANSETASKRTADTGVLLLEFAVNKPASERTIQATARMNYLHSRYHKSGKILESDMLYTMSLFGLEPARWVRKHEWRPLIEVELCVQNLLEGYGRCNVNILWENFRRMVKDGLTAYTGLHRSENGASTTKIATWSQQPQTNNYPMPI